MMAAIPTTYHHTQRSPLYILIYGPGLIALILAIMLSDSTAIAIPFLIVGLALGFVGACFYYLTISDDEDRLSIQFGPLPLFRRSVRYADVRNVEVARTSIFDGWGIHWTVRGGWLWNTWGRDCVLMTFDRGRTLRLGTDEPDELCDFLKSRVVLKAMDTIEM